jgi:polyisoprenoid-binding protein YceI
MRLWLCAAGLALAAVGASAAPRTYAIDPSHSTVVFFVSHLGYAHAVGRFNGIHGTVEFDPRDRQASRVAVEIDVRSLDMGEARWTRSMLRRPYFDVERFPSAHYRSRTVTWLDRERLRIDGELTLLGVTRPVVLEARFNRRGRHPLTLRDTVGFSATARLSRAAFGMDANPDWIGDTVELRIELEAARRRSPTAPDDSQEPRDPP